MVRSAHGKSEGWRFESSGRVTFFFIYLFSFFQCFLFCFVLFSLFVFFLLK